MNTGRSELSREFISNIIFRCTKITEKASEFKKKLKYNCYPDYIKRCNWIGKINELILKPFTTDDDFVVAVELGCPNCESMIMRYAHEITIDPDEALINYISVLFDNDYACKCDNFVKVDCGINDENMYELYEIER